MAVTPWRARAQCRRAKEECKKGSTIYKAVFLTPNDRNKFPNSPKSIEIPPTRSKACMDKELFKRQTGIQRSNRIREIKIVKDNGGINEQAEILELFASILPKVEAFNSCQQAAVCLKASKQIGSIMGTKKPMLIKSQPKPQDSNDIGEQWDQVVADEARLLTMHAF